MCVLFFGSLLEPWCDNCAELAIDCAGIEVEVSRERTWTTTALRRRRGSARAESSGRMETEKGGLWPTAWPHQRVIGHLGIRLHRNAMVLSVYFTLLGVKTRVAVAGFGLYIIVVYNEGWACIYVGICPIV